MDRNQQKREKREESREEFAAGFFAGLAIVGGLALILLAIFWAL